MKKKILIINLSIVVALLGCSTSFSVRDWFIKTPEDATTPQVQDETQPVDRLAEDWQEDIEQLEALFASLSLPDYFMVENPTFQGGEFDVMEVFDILDHIGMEEGYRLAYVYQYDFMGGYPILYAIETDVIPYLSYQAFLDDREECVQGGESEPECNYLGHVEVDGSELGYLQLLLMDVMGNQFYLFWHAGYNDAVFVATQNARDELVESISDPFIPLTRQQRSQASRINLTPSVNVGTDTVEIRAVWFTKWGGFYESSYSINRSRPYLINIDSTKNLVEYDCGLMF